MKKILLFALLLTAFAVQGQNTITRAAWGTWNLDTFSFKGTTSAGVAFAESRVINAVPNATINVQVLVATKHDTLDTGGLTLWSSMDNTNWTKVEFNKSWYPSPIFISRSPVAAYVGTWPNIRISSVSISSLGTASAYTAADTIAYPASPSLLTGNAVLYQISIVNPLANYYKFTEVKRARANTNAKVTTTFIRYWTRKSY
jgi:hypothetical protein